jgi:hypothetical protein
MSCKKGWKPRQMTVKKRWMPRWTPIKKKIANLKTQIGYLASRIEVNQEKMYSWLGKMKAW